MLRLHYIGIDEHIIVNTFEWVTIFIPYQPSIWSPSKQRDYTAHGLAWSALLKMTKKH